MRKFDIVTNCSINYKDALDFCLPSWIRNSGADRILIYTDGEIENKWGDKVKILPIYPASDNWMEWCNRKPETLRRYLETAVEGTTFFLTDVDCYAVKSWRFAVEDLGWWIKTIRSDKSMPDHSDKDAVSIFFGVVCEDMYKFVCRWEKRVKKLNEEKPKLVFDLGKNKLSGHDQVIFQLLLKECQHVVHLNENIWSSERDDYEEWKKIITKYKNDVRVLHFKGGRWKDKKIVSEILALLPDVKEYYHNHSQVKKISARILRILSYLPPLITNKKILDVGCGNKLITTCMSVYGDVKGIDIDDDILTYESDEQYDVVTCFDVFEHLTDVPKAIEQVKKLCKPGGFILVNQPEVQHPKQPIDNLVPIEALFGLGKLIFLEYYAFSKLVEAYNFMVFVR